MQAIYLKRCSWIRNSQPIYASTHIKMTAILKWIASKIYSDIVAILKHTQFLMETSGNTDQNAVKLFYIIISVATKENFQNKK